MRKRILNIVNEVFDRIEKQTHKIRLNEAKLEEFQELLSSMLEIDDGQVQLNVSKPHISGNLSLKHQKIHDNSHLSSDIMCNIDTKLQQLEVLEIDSREVRKVRMPPGTCLDYCKYLVADNQIYITGGTLPRSNDKSHNIHRISSDFKIKKVGTLIQPRSSHAVLYVPPFIYIVGGSRNQHILTKSCERFNTLTKQSEQIACLNYCTAGASLCLFNQKIYKIGGKGASFSSYGLSPYIQRFDGDSWELVNPNFSLPTPLRQHFELLAMSAAIQLDSDNILIMGGYDRQKQPRRQAFKITIYQDAADIKEFDAQYLPIGCGMSNSCIVQHAGKVYMTVDNSAQTLLSGKLVLCFDGRDCYSID